MIITECKWNDEGWNVTRQKMYSYLNYLDVNHLLNFGILPNFTKLLMGQNVLSTWKRVPCRGGSMLPLLGTLAGGTLAACFIHTSCKFWSFFLNWEQKGSYEKRRDNKVQAVLSRYAKEIQWDFEATTSLQKTIQQAGGAKCTAHLWTNSEKQEY